MSKFDTVQIHKEQITNIVEIGLKYNPTPWYRLGSSVEEIVQSMITKIKQFVNYNTGTHLFSVDTYLFPSTLCMFTKVWDEQERSYSTSVIRCDLLYRPSFTSEYSEV